MNTVDREDATHREKTGVLNYTNLEHSTKLAVDRGFDGFDWVYSRKHWKSGGLAHGGCVKCI
eukprot:979094-Pyramimonas_sp.AAC.2